jgi:mono/diheme cytochrome c family protein
MTAPRRILALFALATLAAACSNDVGPPTAVDATGLYGQMCARCHGLDGHGDPEMRKVLPKIRDFADPAFRSLRGEQVERTIMTGKEQMPSFGAMLSQTKIQHLAGYVRRLGAGMEIPAKGMAPAAAAEPAKAPPGQH